MDPKNVIQKNISGNQMEIWMNSLKFFLKNGHFYTDCGNIFNKFSWRWAKTIEVWCVQSKFETSQI